MNKDAMHGGPWAGKQCRMVMHAPLDESRFWDQKGSWVGGSSRRETQLVWIRDLQDLEETVMSGDLATMEEIEVFSSKGLKLWEELKKFSFEGESPYGDCSWKLVYLYFYIYIFIVLPKSFQKSDLGREYSKENICLVRRPTQVQSCIFHDSPNPFRSDLSVQSSSYPWALLGVPPSPKNKGFKNLLFPVNMNFCLICIVALFFGGGVF